MGLVSHAVHRKSTLGPRLSWRKVTKYVPRRNTVFTYRMFDELKGC